MNKLKVAVHKFSSCDGCQLAFLNMGEALIQLYQLINIVHFIEAGHINPNEPVDIAFIEGSVSTPDEIERIKAIRNTSRYLIVIGACATSGGIQALRNGKDIQEWISSVYASPEYIESLDKASPISQYVRVDFEISGCPITSDQIQDVIMSLYYEVTPKYESESVCIECKRQQHPCVMIMKKLPCMGPVTQNGCGALCPSVGRACYACFGPANTINTASLVSQFKTLGLNNEEIVKRFNFITNGANAFKTTVKNILQDGLIGDE